MKQEANNNIGSSITMVNININGVESIKAVTEELSKVINSSDQINISGTKEKVNKIYSKIAPIVNNPDSLYYISNKNKEFLKKCIIQLETFEDDYKEESDDGIVYYQNMFSTLLRIDCEKLIDKYKCAPSYAKENLPIKYLYSSALYEQKEYAQSIEVLDELLHFKNDSIYYAQKCMCMFLNNDYDNLHKTIKKISKKNCDCFGYIGALDVILSSEKKSKKSDLDKLCKKYSGMPLFHLAYAETIFNTSKNESQIKEHVKKAIYKINADDISLMISLIAVARRVKQNELVIKAFKDMNINSIYIKSKFFELMVTKEKKSNEEIDLMNSILVELEKTDINMDFDLAKAEIAFKNNKELEAIDHYINSFFNNKQSYVACNIIKLVLKNNDTRHLSVISDCINYLKMDMNYRNSMVIALGYSFLNNINEAVKYAYYSLVLLNNAYDLDIYRKFWLIVMNSEFKMESNEISDNCVIVLENGKDRKNILIDNELSLNFNIKKIFKAALIENDDSMIVKLLGKTINDSIKIDGKDYKIVSIIDKISYCYQMVFSKLNINSNSDNEPFIQLIKSDNKDNFIDEIKHLLKEDRESVKEKFEYYDLENGNNKLGLPLNYFVNGEDKTFREILLFLLYNPKYKVYSGEINNLCIEPSFVIDISSLIMLNHFECLNLLLKYKKNIFITQSLYNYVDKVFKYYLNEKKEKMTLFMGEDDKLYRNEMTKEDSKMIRDFWREILEICKQFNIVNHESVLPHNYINKSQIDCMDLAIKENVNFVCDDLFVRKCFYSLKQQAKQTTNFVALLGLLDVDIDRYIYIIEELSKGNYLYCVESVRLKDLILFSEQEKKYRNSICNILNNILSTKFLYDNYIELLYKTFIIILCYYKVNDKEYIHSLLNIIIEKSVEYKIDNNAKIFQNIKKELN